MVAKRGMINNTIQTNSKTRAWCFDMKKKMILNPLRSITMTICFGFIVNINFMVTIVILYEKVNYLIFQNSSI
jgi:hypothetical protein